MLNEDDWAEPQEVSDVLMAFPGDVMHLMPAYEDVPTVDAKWSIFQSHWFLHGLSGDTAINYKDGIDPNKAMRHLACIQGSFEPKHEHKAAAVAYLASRWFNDWHLPGVYESPWFDEAAEAEADANDPV